MGTDPINPRARAGSDGMHKGDKLLRAMVDAAFMGRRAWDNVGDLAWHAGVGESLAYKAIAHPIKIGAVARLAGGGISVVDPERLLMIFSARRSLARARRTRLDVIRDVVSTAPHYAVGGSRAATHHLGGINTIADDAEAIIYVPDGTYLDDLPRGRGALVFATDEHTLRSWSAGFTSRAQTYADLFAQPGWQASEFRRALWRAWFEVDDWSGAEAQ